jgi:hypothetical protein
MNPKQKALSKAPTPFQMIGSGVRSVGSSIGRALSKVAGKVMGPTVRAGKIKDASMQEMDRKAKAGEFNQ